MSGYLQRLALRAMNPVEPVHPVLGSVFSAPKYGSEREGSPMEGEDFFSSHAESQHPVESVHAVSGSAFPASQYGSRPESLMSPAPPRPFHDPRPGPEPLIRSDRMPTPQVKQTPRPIFRESTAFAPSGPRSPHETSRKAESNRESDAHRERQGREGGSEPAYAPLIKESFARPGNQEIFPREAHAFASAARVKSDSPGRPVPTQRDPDEIQIHIGRIDVTAVPQAAARAVTKPARKGLNLEEYLRGRDRRA